MIRAIFAKKKREKGSKKTKNKKQKQNKRKETTEMIFIWCSVYFIRCLSTRNHIEAGNLFINTIEVRARTFDLWWKRKHKAKNVKMIWLRERSQIITAATHKAILRQKMIMILWLNDFDYCEWFWLLSSVNQIVLLFLFFFSPFFRFWFRFTLSIHRFHSHTHTHTHINRNGVCKIVHRLTYCASHTKFICFWNIVFSILYLVDDCHFDR